MGQIRLLNWFFFFLSSLLSANDDEASSMAGYESLWWLLIYDFLCEFTFICLIIRRKSQNKTSISIASNFTLLTLHNSCFIYINPIWDDHTRTPRPDGNRTTQRRAFVAHDRTRWGFNTDWVDWQAAAAAARRRCRRERMWVDECYRGEEKSFVNEKQTTMMFFFIAQRFDANVLPSLHFDFFYVRQFARIVWTKWPQIFSF